jgi:NSS family neurotransmitter:Na+ symporter
MGFGVYSCSLLAGLAVVPTAFALLAPDQAMEAMRAGNQGLMFIWIPQLFYKIPAGGVFLVAFMTAVVFAAISSIIAMFELAVRILMDTGLERRRALVLVTVATIAVGLPSALSLDFFDNQDYVWGQGLLLSGLFISIAATRYGMLAFRTRLVNAEGNDLNVGPWYGWILRYLVPAQIVVMFIWWAYQAIAGDPSGWWNPAHKFSLGTCVVQWGAALAVLGVFNRAIAAASTREATTSETASR